MPTQQPLVGGEPARRILDLIRSFPLSVHDRRFEIHNTATGEDREMFDRAYEQVELEVLTDQAKCSAAHEHRTLDEHEYRQLVMTYMVDDAKTALGIEDELDPLWD